MNEYISRDDVRSMVLKYRADNPKKQTVWAMVISDMLRDLKEIPAADVQPIRRGRWMTSHPVDIAKEFKCTTCGGLVELPVFAKKCYYDFCPNCGARMIQDGEEE